MDSILLFKKDLDRYTTSDLVVLQHYFGLPTTNRGDLAWLLAIYQAENNPRGTMRGKAEIGAAKKVGKYYIEKELGSGRFGTVYLGEDEKGKKIVIKIVEREKVEGSKRMKNKVMRDIFIPKYINCRHKNIICLLDYKMGPVGDYFIVTEYVEGGRSLEKVGFQFAPNALSYLDIYYQLADGLEFMHKLDIAHRDLKLENVILKGTTPIIIDFDLACIKDSDDYKCTDMVGTPDYIAPEVWIDGGYEFVDPFKADIYSLGVLFYELSNDRRSPYGLSPSDGIAEVERAAIHDEQKKSETQIPELNDLIMRMLSKDPDLRPSLEHIKDVLQGLIKTHE